MFFRKIPHVSFTRLWSWNIQKTVFSVLVSVLLLFGAGFSVFALKLSPLLVATSVLVPLVAISASCLFVFYSMGEWRISTRPLMSLLIVLSVAWTVSSLTYQSYPQYRALIFSATAMLTLPLGIFVLYKQKLSGGVWSAVLFLAYIPLLQLIPTPFGFWTALTVFGVLLIVAAVTHWFGENREYIPMLAFAILFFFLYELNGGCKDLYDTVKTGTENIIAGLQNSGFYRSPISESSVLRPFSAILSVLGWPGLIATFAFLLGIIVFGFWCAGKKQCLNRLFAFSAMTCFTMLTVYQVLVSFFGTPDLYPMMPFFGTDFFYNGLGIMIVAVILFPCDMFPYTPFETCISREIAVTSPLDNGTDNGVISLRFLQLSKYRQQVKDCFLPEDAVVALLGTAFDILVELNDYCSLWQYDGEISDAAQMLDELTLTVPINVVVRIAANGKAPMCKLLEIANTVTRKGENTDVCIIEDNSIPNKSCKVMILTA